MVDGVPFLVTREYSIGGLPEQSSSNLAYCVEQCDWSRLRFQAKSPAEKAAALKKLLPRTGSRASWAGAAREVPAGR